MEFDPLILSRIQFAVTVGFHFIFPPLTIGMAWLLVIYEWLGWKKQDKDYQTAAKFFAKILALTFAIGVATGIVMEFQFGTNWAEYSKFVGDIFGAPLAAEAVFAFFLESTFLGLYLFGRDKVSKGLHWFSSLMVAVGATISAFWIIVANSWMQTPAGFTMNNGRAELTDFMAAVFNASTWPRYLHTMNAALVAGAFMVVGVSGWLVMKKKGGESMKKSLKVGIIFAFITSITCAFPTGHEHVIQVAKTQPEKFAVMEGIVEGRTDVPFTLFGVLSEAPPDLSNELNIPGMVSFLLGNEVQPYVKGIRDFHEEGVETPPFIMTFFSFHTMVALGSLFILLTGIGVFLLWKKKLFEANWFHKVMFFSIPLPLIACQVGWILAEVGRQPWIVYKVMKTKDAFSMNVSGEEVFFSLILFSIIYLCLGGLYLFLMGRKIKAGPETAKVEGGK